MKTRILLATVSFISITALAQNVIRIRPQHQKEHLYTLKEGEGIGRKESTLDMHLTGANYRFLTTKGRDQFWHTRSGKKRLIGARNYPTVFKNWRIKTIGDKVLVENRYTSQAYGPINPPNINYDYRLERDASGTYVTTKSDLFGFVYTEKQEADGKVDFYVVRSGKAAQGPFLSARVRYATEEEFTYSYTTEEGQFLMKNDDLFGPYEALSYDKHEYMDDRSIILKVLFTYKIGAVWKIKHEKLEGYTFSKQPRYNRSRKGLDLFVNIIEKGDKTFRVLADGSIEEKSDYYFIERNEQGEKLIFEGIDDTTYGAHFITYRVSIADSVIGEFNLHNESYSRICANTKSDYFEIPLIPADSIAGNRYFNARVFYSPTRGFTKPIVNKFNSQSIYFFEDDFALYDRNSDTLIIGDDIYSNVLQVDFINDPGNWYMLRKEGDFDQPYKNGRKTKVTKSTPDYWGQYNLPEKDFVLAERNEEYFIRPRRSGKLLGPVEKNASVVISKDENNYAECKRIDNTVWINNKLMSSGFYLVYNEEMDAFHWFSITDDNKIYLHTYELN